MYFDVCILGGGPAGLSASLALSSIGAKVAVIEKADYTKTRYGEHIPAAGLSTLLHIGLSPSEVFDSSNHLKSSGIRSYWSGKENHIDYFSHPVGFGLNLSRPEFDRKLADTAVSKGATILTNARLLQSLRTNGAWALLFRDEQSSYELRSRFIVDASGRGAVFARKRGERVIRFDSQIAVNRRFELLPSCTGSDLTCVVIEPCSVGWWYLCPLASGSLICTLFSDTDLFNRDRESAELEWLKYISEASHVSALLAGCMSTPISYWSASTQRLSNIQGDDWIAVGDAAFSFDPLSGQGITKAIRHGWVMGLAIGDYLDGDREALRQATKDAEQVFSGYLRTWHEYYELEKRWTDSQFWSRRSAPISPCIQPGFAGDAQAAASRQTKVNQRASGLSTGN